MPLPRVRLNQSKFLTGSSLSIPLFPRVGLAAILEDVTENGYEDCPRKIFSFRKG